MKVNVGSKNQVKINAVEEILKDYPIFVDAKVVGVDAQVPEFGHPKTMDETVVGAQQRAKDVFDGCDYSFGIESGMMVVSASKTGFMHMTICAIYDGLHYHLGCSSMFEFPKKVTELILKENLDGSQAYKKAGLTSESKIGATHGAIYDLSKGRMDRKEYTKQAIMMALIHLENPELY